MDKKPESSWEEAERLGPYQLHEHMPQSEKGHGELYRATHQTSGATALVLKPAPDDKGARLPDWRGRWVSSASPGYLAMEVEHSRWARSPDRYSLEALVFMFEELHDGVKRMALAVADEPRPLWRLGLALASAAAVCALFFALGSLTPGASPPEDPEPSARAAHALMSHEVLTDGSVPPTGNGWLMGPVDGGLSVPGLAHPFPKKPYKGQRRPPCKPRVEVEIMGACWIPHELKAPCPEDLYEYQGKCYTTSMQPPPEPRSLGQ